MKRESEPIQIRGGASGGPRQGMELVYPGGTLEKLKIALSYGADAVYVSGEEYGLRKRAGNLSIEELKAAATFAHERNSRVYVGVNIFARNDDVAGLASYLQQLSEAEIDAVIVADPGVFAMVRKCVPNARIHISTQANVTNWKAAEFWRSLGADRIVLSRELTVDEVGQIAARTSAEIEVFVHGAMCVAYSGRCLLSAHLTGRSSNLGECAQPCRWRYRLLPDGAEASALVIEQDNEGTYLLSSVDLCMIRHLRKLMEAGVAAVKIEGRMKSLYYVAAATRTYREALAACSERKRTNTVEREWLDELSHLTRRGYTTGFYLGENAGGMQEKQDRPTGRDQRFLGLVLQEGADGLMKVRAFNRIQVGQTVEIMSFVRKNDRRCTVTEMLSANGERIEKAGAGKIVYIRSSRKGRPNEILRAV